MYKKLTIFLLSLLLMAVGSLVAAYFLSEGQRRDVYDEDDALFI